MPFIEFSTYNEENYSGNCVICMENVPKSHYKLKCCDARYHIRCLYKAMTEGATNMCVTKQCLMCKKSVGAIEIDKPHLSSLISKLSDIPVPIPVTPENSINDSDIDDIRMPSYLIFS